MSDSKAPFSPAQVAELQRVIKEKRLSPELAQELIALVVEEAQLIAKPGPANSLDHINRMIAVRERIEEIKSGRAAPRRRETQPARPPDKHAKLDENQLMQEGFAQGVPTNSFPETGQASNVEFARGHLARTKDGARRLREIERATRETFPPKDDVFG